VEPVFPCFVIRGSVTTYSEQKTDEATLAKVRAAIQNAIETGDLDNADNRLLGITWRDLKEAPIPGEGGPTDSPGTGGNPDDDPNIDRASDGENGLETWSIALIAVGGAVTFFMAYLCLRRPSHSALYDDDDNDSSKSSSSSDSDEDEKEDKSEPFVPPMPIYRPPPPFQEEKEDHSRLPPVEEQQEYNFQSTPAVVASRSASQSGHTSGSEIEEASESNNQSDVSESTESNLSSGDGDAQDTALPSAAGDQSHVTLDLEDALREDPSMLSNMDFTQSTSQFEQDFGKENAFGKAAAANAANPGETSESFSSEYSSYEEDLDEEYEIEYVEDEDGLESVAEEEEEEEEEVEDQFWDEHEEVAQGEAGQTPILPWLGPSSSHSTQSFS
jgi:hypothetical protein